jgi:hypothetical protein
VPTSPRKQRANTRKPRTTVGWDGDWYKDDAKKCIHGELVQAGMDRARQQGKRIGRPSVTERDGFSHKYNTLRRCRMKKLFFILTGIILVVVVITTIGCGGNGGGKNIKVQDILEGGYINQEVILRGQLVYEFLFLSNSPLYLDFADETGFITAKCSGQLPESNSRVTINALVKRDSTGSIYLLVESWRY